MTADIDIEDTDPRGDTRGSDLLRALVNSQMARSAAGPGTTGVVIGELVAIADGGRTPLVVYPGQPGTTAVAARSVVDLHGAHVGRPVALAFEGADPARPIVMGVVRQADEPSLEPRPGSVEVEADGERLVVCGREQLVLRCGRASITLTKAGKVLIEGAYVSSRSTGVNRLRGGSIQLN
jgi:hypothetical protein